MPTSRKNSNKKTVVQTNTNENETQIKLTNHRGRRLLKNIPLHQHTQAMREAKRLREQIRVRAVNGEYTHLNQTLGLKNEYNSLPKISKQQTLKTCISHIKTLRAELTNLTGQPQLPISIPQEGDSLKHIQEDQTNHTPDTQMYIPTFPMYMPSFYPLPTVTSEVDGYSSIDTHSFSSDELAPYNSFSYSYPCTDTDYESMVMSTQQEDDGSVSDLQNVSEAFSSELFTDFPNYSDSFCSTPELPSSPYSWLLPLPQWTPLDNN